MATPEQNRRYYEANRDRILRERKLRPSRAKAPKTIETMTLEELIADQAKDDTTLRAREPRSGKNGPTSLDARPPHLRDQGASDVFTDPTFDEVWESLKEETDE